MHICLTSRGRIINQYKREKYGTNYIAKLFLFFVFAFVEIHVFHYPFVKIMHKRITIRNIVTNQSKRCLFLRRFCKASIKSHMVKPGVPINHRVFSQRHGIRPLEILYIACIFFIFEFRQKCKANINTTPLNKRTNHY